MVFMKTFFCRENPMPELLLPALKNVSETGVNETMYVIDRNCSKHAARH